VYKKGEFSGARPQKDRKVSQSQQCHRTVFARRRPIDSLAASDDPNDDHGFTDDVGVVDEHTPARRPAAVSLSG
jgi:hypothetical protein